MFLYYPGRRTQGLDKQEIQSFFLETKFRLVFNQKERLAKIYIFLEKSDAASAWKLEKDVSIPQFELTTIAS